MATVGSCLFVIGVCLYTSSLASPLTNDTTTPPTYDINLDLDPYVRWNHVIQDYQAGKHGAPVNFTQFVLTVIDKYIPPKLQTLTEIIAADLDNIIPTEYAREIKGVANATGLPLGWAVAVTLIYDVTAFCTSIVVQNDRDEIYHGRNLDYDFGSMLRDITFNANFQKNGTTLYSGVTYAGIVGLFTGQRPGAFTVSIDERDRGYWFENALEMLESLITRKTKLISLISRQALEHSISFQDATMKIGYANTWAPAYYILGGVHVGEGVVITKDRHYPLDFLYLEPYNTRWFLLETNYDHWRTPPPNDDRRDPGVAHMKKLGRVGFNTTSLFQVLSTPPVLAKGTTYTTVMSAGKPEVFQTWIRHP